MSAVIVGKIGSFGMSKTEALAQIWQMMLDSRTGAFPFSVTTSGPSGSNNDAVNVGLVSSFGMGEYEFIIQIWQMFYDARQGTVPLVVTSV